MVFFVFKLLVFLLIYYSPYVFSGEKHHSFYSFIDVKDNIVRTNHYPYLNRAKDKKDSVDMITIVGRNSIVYGTFVKNSESCYYPCGNPGEPAMYGDMNDENGIIKDSEIHKVCKYYKNYKVTKKIESKDILLVVKGKVKVSSVSPVKPFAITKLRMNHLSKTFTDWFSVSKSVFGFSKWGEWGNRSSHDFEKESPYDYAYIHSQQYRPFQENAFIPFYRGSIIYQTEINKRKFYRICNHLRKQHSYVFDGTGAFVIDSHHFFQVATHDDIDLKYHLRINGDDYYLFSREKDSFSFIAYNTNNQWFNLKIDNTEDVYGDDSCY